MALAINTNIAALNAQRNLGKTQGMLTKSLQRLSSGLRINSAKDDAAGFAIANRMNAQTRGLNQAVRNVNDGISLAQTAEGALQETTNILLRMRDLAIQSANDTNTATDRASLQSELNQLQQELTRIADSTTFNGTKILDGSLTGAQFQVGAEANQTMSISISDSRATALGSYTVETSNDSGIEASTHAGFYRAAGAEMGVVQAAASGTEVNGYTGEDIIVRDADGNQVGSNVTIAANGNIKTAVTDLNAITGTVVRAVGYNQVTLGNLDAQADGTIVVDSGAAGSATINFTLGDTEMIQSMADTINNDADMQTAGASASIIGGELVISNSTGEDIIVEVTGALNEVDMTGLESTTTEILTEGTDAAGTAGGRFDVYLDQGYTIETTLATGIFAVSTDTVATTAVGYEDADDGNAVALQELNVTGPNGSQTVNVGLDASAYDIATSINAFEADTGVSAEARTTATISNLSDAGTITFGLRGINNAAVNISATISDTTSLSELVTAINNATGETGISAELSDSGASVTLTQAAGHDIDITDFAHSGAVELPNYANPDRVAAEKSITVTGGEDGSTSVELWDGGTKTDADSTVVGGEVTFSAISVFNISSDIAATNAGGSIFSGVADSTNAAALSSANNVDIGTREGAGSAINVIDGALSKVDVIRGDLGAVQNRFESTISNLENVAENLSAARSRIMDADFAVETAALTKAQILQQAGVAMLAQANQLPQTVLSLLQ